jgi:hypothetical protein
MSRAFVATAVLMLALAPSRAASVTLVPLPSEAATNSAAECVTPRTMAAVRPSGKSYELVLTVENPSTEPLELVDFYFFENMLALRAVPAGESKGLALIVPLLSPGPRPLIVAPFARIERTYQLSASFPELEKTLESKDVLVSWQLTLAGEKMCSSQELATSVWLRKPRES